METRAKASIVNGALIRLRGVAETRSLVAERGQCREAW